MLKLWKNPMLSESTRLEIADAYITQLEEMLKIARINNKRYEIIKTMTSKEYADFNKLITILGKSFDEVVDNLAPFVVKD